MSRQLGWDIGGAHVKVALIEDGKLRKVMQRPCALWRGLDKLDSVIKNILAELNLPQHATSHAATMTGELVDLFANRRVGVVSIANLLADLLGKHTRFYAAGIGFVGIDAVSAHALNVASANWCASANLLAKYAPEALFVDIGSTTTDIIPISAGRVANIGFTDALRMREDTLVYTGVVRTPLMALTQKIEFNGAQANVAAEYFATMADVYRLTGDLQPEHDMAETADGKGRSMQDSARRLARMIGYDVEDKPFEAWQMLAQTCKQLQLQQIKMAASKHLKPNTPIIVAGAGAFLGKSLAKSLNCACITVADVLKIELNDALSVCFPAYAVAHLAMLEE